LNLTPGEAMCAFTVDLIDFEQLSDAQRKALLKNYQRKKKALEAQLEDANKSLKGINRALKLIEKKSKRRT
jgi:uncharacterized protein (DUF885 family)